jgi:hypothetical protein
MLMKLDKPTLKKLIKESLEEMSLQLPTQQGLEVTDYVDQEMIESALSTNPRSKKDYLIPYALAIKIARKHRVYESEVIQELGQKDFYKVSELFGDLLQY